MCFKLDVFIFKLLAITFSLPTNQEPDHRRCQFMLMPTIGYCCTVHYKTMKNLSRASSSVHSAYPAALRF